MEDFEGEGWEEGEGGEGREMGRSGTEEGREERKGRG